MVSELYDQESYYVVCPCTNRFLDLFCSIFYSGNIDANLQRIWLCLRRRPSGCSIIFIQFSILRVGYGRMHSELPWKWEGFHSGEIVKIGIEAASAKQMGEFIHSLHDRLKPLTAPNGASRSIPGLVPLVSTTMIRWVTPCVSTP